ncbi:M10 family metallopeptidase C-terminal domain-containing protein, partial [Sphingosinicella terrae]|uniref:M10 family metallopeptidase C-terminal domain-containing protein n=1 Tax=Sphingosinicella terrae TaxID=2172047 RepID=UPI002549021F
AGADRMSGGFGNDTYVVDHVDDQVTELANEGVDRVKSSISYSLGAHVENLYLTGREAINGTGNDLANKIVGNKGNNVLDGRGGADFMQGGLGNDVYVVDDSGDRAIEAAGEGFDTVKSSANFSLEGQELENLTLTGWNPINATGNALANKIIGNEAANVLNGGGGEDLLRGGGGGDSFQFTAALGSSKVAHIEDFSPVEDRIVLGGSSGQAFAALASGVLGSHAFRIGSTAADRDDRILHDRSTGTLYYDADGAGGAAAVKFATLAPNLDMSAADFLVSGPANNAPVFSSGTSATIAENSDASTIVYQASATDADGDAISYALTGADAALFTIDAAGAVRLRAPADYETRTTYSLTVEARDSGPAASSRNVTINVTDVGETVPTRRLYDFEANDDTGSAQSIYRQYLGPSTNPNLANDDLPSATILGDIGRPSDKDFFSIFLQEGELLILDVDFSGGDLDALVKVYSAAATLLAENDDPGSLDAGSDPHPEYGHNTDPFLRFRAPESGTYYFSIEAFSGGTDRTSGSYQLNVSVGPPATPAELLEEDIQAMLSGYRWSASRLTYGFTTSGSQYADGDWAEEISAGMAALSGQQQGAVRTALGQVSNFTNLSFGQAANPGLADLRFALSNLPETAYAIYPGPGMGGDSWYNRTDYADPVVGNYEWTAFLHEAGHALGLKHPHEIPAVSAGRDLLAYTVMSYRSYGGAPVDETGGYTNETWGYAQTYMMLDIAALQRMYGADFSYNSGNTTYSWSQSDGAFMIDGKVQWTPGANRIFMTVWDGGGTDTYDFSDYLSDNVIDLRPGQWVKTHPMQLADLGDGRDAPGNIANALLFNGDKRSLIENAIGGAGQDTFIANEAANRFTGNGMNDRFVWSSVKDSPVGAADVITDYQLDYLDFSRIDAVARTSANEAFTLIETNAFSGKAGELRWETTGDRIDIYGDVDGDKVADLHVIAQWGYNGEPSIYDYLFVL